MDNARVLNAIAELLAAWHVFEVVCEEEGIELPEWIGEYRRHWQAQIMLGPADESVETD
jgi:hypothetical protein